MGSRPTRLISRESRIYLGFRLFGVGELGAKRAAGNLKRDPKNSGCVTGAQRMGGELGEPEEEFRQLNRWLLFACRTPAALTDCPMTRVLATQ